MFKQTFNAKQDTQIRKRQRLYTRLNRIKDYLGNPAINTTSLEESGRIDYIVSLAGKELNTGIEIEQTIRKYDTEITNKYGQIRSVPAYLLNYARYFKGK